MRKLIEALTQNAKCWGGFGSTTSSEREVHFPSLEGLVLQFASKGSLEEHLYPETDNQDVCQLGLSECLSITIDVAHCMEYLHHHCLMQLVHCDLNPSNVLLDAKMTALVTDLVYPV